MRDNRVSDGHLRGHRQERHRAGRAGHDLRPGRGHRHLRRGRGRGCGLRLRGAGEPAAASHGPLHQPAAVGHRVLRDRVLRVRQTHRRSRLRRQAHLGQHRRGLPRPGHDDHPGQLLPPRVLRLRRHRQDVHPPADVQLHRRRHWLRRRGLLLRPAGHDRRHRGAVRGLRHLPAGLRGVTTGVRASTGRVLRMRLLDPFIQASGDVIGIVGGCILDRPEIAGGYLEGAGIWTPGNDIREHNIHDAHMRGTSTSTPLALASAGTARPGRVVNNRFSTSSTPLVMLSRALPGEIIEGNTFVGVAFSAAGLASTGRGVVRGNMSIDVTVGSHLDSTPPRCSPKPAPRRPPGRGSAATRSSTAPRSPGRSSARCASPPAHPAPGRATGPSRRDPSS
jgi:hypothetical protein